ncbi:uncharacterized protein LOC134222523 [Armigeres subalbatus]|uniref:uncharacterized protein LOC134222523 n=1 Tax=Armigeres subalbatus TaxID=124917 RepID=UPI002ED5498C
MTFGRTALSPTSGSDSHMTGRDSSKFRPISLTSCARKIMKRMVSRPLRGKLEADGRFGFQQHAFRPGYGTSTYFASLGSVLQSAYNEAKHVDLVSMDIAKAFSRTWTPMVLNKLQEWGTTDNMLAFIKNLLTGTTFTVLIGDSASGEYAEETGVPKGRLLWSPSS